MSKLFYGIFASLWAVALLLTLLICIDFAWLGGILIPFVVAGVMVIGALPIINKVSRKPLLWSVALIALLHIIAIAVVIYVNPQKKNSFYELLALLVGFSVVADIIQLVLILKWRQIIDFISERRKQTAFLFCAVGAIAVAVIIFKAVFFPTTWRYCDRKIIGDTIDEIKQQHGEFDKVFYYESGEMASAGYFLDDGKGFFSNIQGFDSYYMIYFDKQGIATFVEIDGGWGG